MSSGKIAGKTTAVNAEASDVANNAKAKRPRWESLPLDAETPDAAGNAKAQTTGLEDNLWDILFRLSDEEDTPESDVMEALDVVFGDNRVKASASLSSRER